MKLGAVYFFTDRGPDPLDFARRMERAGFDSLFVPEHTHIPASRRTPYPSVYGGGELPWYYARMLDQVVTLSAIASVTTTLQLGTGVSLVAQHDPIVHAKELATLDRLSGGRLILGVGMGWNQDEAEAHGVVWKHRLSVAREKVAVMKTLWTDDVASFSGEFVRLEPSWQWPKPHRSGGPEVWLGGAGPLTLTHAARWADGIYIVPPPDDPTLTRTLGLLRRALEKEQRDPASLTIAVASAPGDLEILRRYEEQGVAHAVLDLDPTEPSRAFELLDGAADVVRRYRAG